MKVYQVIQDDERDPKDIKRMESYVTASSLADVAAELASDEEDIDHILIAIVEVGTVVRNIAVMEE